MAAADYLSIEQLVKGEFNGLSPAQKKVAEFLLLHPEECALLTAAQISREASVSETTVIRLSYALGFSNFSEMQQRMRERMLKNNAPPQIPVHLKSDPSNETNLLTNVLEKDIAILKQLLQQVDQGEIWKAVDALIQADRVLIAGFRVSYAAAYWFSFMLGMIHENVQLCASGGDDYAKLIDLSEKSVVVAISVPRYSKELLTLANQAKKRKVTLISVTDRLLSPVGRISDITLTTDINVDTGMTSVASIISVLNLLINGITIRDQKRFQTRQQQLEQLYVESDIFIE